MSEDRPPLDPRLAPLAETRVELDESGFPAEVMCRQCRHFMLPEDEEGRTWCCWICRRRIVVVPKLVGG